MALVFLEASLRIVPLLQKNTGKTRRGNFVILCLGNSITKGDTLPPGQAYPEQLEKILNLKFP